MQHLLKKQVIDLEIGTALNAYAVQHSMSHHFWKHIYPLLEKIFDELASENEVIKLDTLEIDLGCIEHKYIELATWPATYLQEIENKLRHGLQTQIKEKKEQKEPRETAVFRQWLFYMENGHLPWNGINLKKESNVVLESLATEYSSITALRQLLLRNPVALNRIILQHDESFLQNLVAVLTTKKQQGLIAIIDEMMALPGIVQKPKAGTSLLPVHHARKNIWRQVLSFAATKEQPGMQEVVHHVLSQHISNASVAQMLVAAPSVKSLSIYSIISQIVATFPVLPGNESIQQTVDDVQASLQEARPPNSKSAQVPPTDQDEKNNDSLPDKNISENKVAETFVASHASPALKKDAEFEAEHFPANETINKHPSLSTKKDSPTTLTAADATGEPDLSNPELFNIPELEEGLFIGSAGLVLTHPFLFTLFKKLHWVENGKFTEPDNQQRALYLLQYMATGETTAEEYELVIAKLLCGYPLQKPVSKEIIINEAAICEADNMLEALIAQWEILKQTSISGLREGFFQRNGKLFTKNERLYLHVETKSIDVLLDKLPWNLSIIKLPWMKDLLNVDWR